MSYSFLLVSGKANTVTVPVGSAFNGQSAVLHRKTSTISSTGVIANGKATFNISSDRVTEFAGNYSITVGSAVIQNGDVDIIPGAITGSGGSGSNVDLTDYYTKVQVNSLTSGAVSAKADKTYVDSQLATKAANADLNNKADISDLKAVATTGVYSDLTGKPDLNGFATTSALSTAVATKANISDVYDKTSVDSALAAKAATTALTAGLATKANTTDVYTKSQIDTSLSTKAAATDLTTGLAAKANVVDVYTKPQVDTSLSAKADFTALADKLATSDIQPVTGLYFRVQNLAVTAGVSQAILTWELPTAVDGISGFSVRYRNAATPATWTVASYVAANATTATVTGLTNGVEYEFDVEPRYGKRATPNSPALYSDLFSGTSTWNAANPRSAADGSSTTPWSILTASTTSPSWQYRIYSGAVRADLGNQAMHAVLDTGAASGRTIRASWSTLHATLSTKRRAEIVFRSSNTDNINFWGVHVNDGTYLVRKVIAGTSTVLFTSSVTAANGDSILITLGASNVVTVTVNGTQLWTGTDTDLAANQFAGFRMVANASGSSTTAQDQTSALDYFQVSAS